MKDTIMQPIEKKLKVKTESPKLKEISASGRRKTSRCTVKLLPGEGESLVNGMKLEEYFTQIFQKANILKPLAVSESISQYHFRARVSGGGRMGQADAVKLAIAKSLASISDDLHKLMAKEGLLTRDQRAKERKKIFFVRARKKPQYSKR